MQVQRSKALGHDGQCRTPASPLRRPIGPSGKQVKLSLNKLQSCIKCAFLRVWHTVQEAEPSTVLLWLFGVILAAVGACYLTYAETYDSSCILMLVAMSLVYASLYFPGRGPALWWSLHHLDGEASALRELQEQMHPGYTHGQWAGWEEVSTSSGQISTGVAVEELPIPARPRAPLQPPSPMHWQ